MPQQIGMGFGKGRRVIKTIVAGDGLRRALEKHQRFVETHVSVDDVHDLWRRAHAVPIPNLERHERAPRRQMAKASLRSGDERA